MRNRDKYQKYDELKAAFNAFCLNRFCGPTNCRNGFGHLFVICRCVLCYEMWKDADFDAEEAEKLERQMQCDKARDAFCAKYPGLWYDAAQNGVNCENLFETYTEISVRAYNVLQNYKIKTVDDLLGLSIESFAKFKGAGRRTTHEVAQAQDSLRRLIVDQEKTMMGRDLC